VVSLGSILLLAPIGRDAAELQRVMAAVGIASRPLLSIAELCVVLTADGGVQAAAIFLTEEALSNEITTLASALEQQPSWSDMPIVILTAGEQWRRSWSRGELFKRLGNVTLLNRPLHAETLQSAARAALRARARQHETRQHLEDLQQAAEMLERRVDERTSELMVLQEQLHHAQKMEAIGQLTGGLAHDFNNLLLVISGGAESLQRLLKNVSLGEVGPRFDRAIRMITQGAERAASLTHRLLAFSRRQTLDAKLTDVSSLILEMEDLIRRTIHPAIEIRTCFAEQLRAVLVDQPQLEAALLNLCINARDAMPDGGRLMIDVANVEADVATANRLAIDVGGYVAISVTDTGTGIAPDVLARVFEPFFTTKPMGQGTGLGLSMVYGFAQQSGGGVEIQSCLGKGTTVRILLPHHDGATEAPSTQPSTDLTSTISRAATVVVVDDEPVVRLLVSEAMTSAGYHVLEAEDGPSGLKILHSDVAVDLLISDVSMPGGMNGRQLADVARQRRPDLPILFITGYAHSPLLRRDNLETDMHILSKPFAMDVLIQRVQQILKS
jgi:signal transduction histidine kinase